MHEDKPFSTEIMLFENFEMVVIVWGPQRPRSRSSEHMSIINSMVCSAISGFEECTLLNKKKRFRLME